MRSISDQEYPFFARHSVPVTVRIAAQQSHGAKNGGNARGANPRRRVAWETKFCMATPNIYGLSVLKLFHVALPGI